MTRNGHPDWGLGVGLTTHHRKKNKFVTTISVEPWTWMDSLDKRTKWVNGLDGWIQLGAPKMDLTLLCCMFQ
jgi:hypothetical protein